MEELFLARLQFASTTLFHFIFVPLSIGLAFIIALMQTMYVIKDDEMYKDMAKFWGKLFLINFAVGVVTGIIQEFQFGMNWSSYSRFVGDVFGAPLAIEALLAFFMESTFIGLWIFGWNKLPKKLHLACIWFVSIGTALSALWILIANSFMQNPLGYHLANGRAEMNDFFAVITNPKVLVAYPHTIFASLATGSFLILGISAWKILKKQDVEFFKKSMKIPFIVGLIATLGIAFSGHSQAKYLIDAQPMKMAAAEGIWEDTSDPAPFTLFGIIDTKNKETTARIEIPFLLSYLAYGEFSGSLEGMHTIQKKYEEQYGEGDYIPPVKTTFWSFRIMVAAGGLMILLSLIGLIKLLTGKLENGRGFLKWLILAISFPIIANFSGWIMSEMGRQPWIVQGLMTTADALSPNVSNGSILFSITAFMLIFILLSVAMVYLFMKVIKKGPYAVGEEEVVSADPFSEGRNIHGA